MDFQSETNLEDLHQKISAQFEKYKEELNSKDHCNMNHLLYNMNVESDTLLYKIKYETEKYVNENFKDRKTPLSFEDTGAVNLKKAEYLIKLQTLTSMLTCHVVEDYKKLLQDKDNQQY